MPKLCIYPSDVDVEMFMLTLTVSYSGMQPKYGSVLMSSLETTGLDPFISDTDVTKPQSLLLGQHQMYIRSTPTSNLAKLL